MIGEFNLRIFRNLVIAFSFASTPCIAIAQQHTNSPSKNSGPALDVTMKFIEDKLNEQEDLTYTTTDVSEGTEDSGGGPWGHSANNVHANPATCLISYHMKETIMGSNKLGEQAMISLPDRTGDPIPDRDVSFSLNEVRDLTIRTGLQYMNDRYARMGSTFTATRVDPPVFVLGARRSGNQENIFIFRDEEMANRVAKAMLHAVELCGGGGHPEPF